MGFKAHFARVLCGEKAAGTASKGGLDPKALATMADDLGCAVDQVAYVGDSAADLEAGREAGMRIVAVSWGYQRKEDLMQIAPDYFFDAPQQA